MKYLLILIVLLLTVTASTSYVLPFLSIKLNKPWSEPLGLESVPNDNIFRNKFITRNIFYNIFCKNSLEQIDIKDDFSIMCKNFKQNLVDNAWDNEINNSTDIGDNLYHEGFQKEQWHNYPRQLDRLHLQAEESEFKQIGNLDPVDVTNTVNLSQDEENANINEILSNYNPPLTDYDTLITATNPFLILKIQLANMNKKMNSDVVDKQIMSKNENANEFNENEELESNEDIINQSNAYTEKEKAIVKRVFSFWSRVQDLGPKGHKLHNRRHLHPFYGMSNAERNGMLSAEPRASFMRPPGSPLRWG